MFPLFTVAVLYANIFALSIESVLSRPRQLTFVLPTHRYHRIQPTRNNLKVFNRSRSMTSFQSDSINGVENRVCDVLTKAIEKHVDGNANCNEFIFDVIDQSSVLVKRLGSEALTHTDPQERGPNLLTTNYGANDLSSRLRDLSNQSLTTTHNLQRMMYQMNRSGSKKTSGNAWRTLQSIVNTSIDVKNKNLESASIGLAILSLGVAISTNSDVDNAQQKMIASAILPNSPSHIFERETCKDVDSRQTQFIKAVARDSLLHLLRTLEGNDSIDCIARIETAFRIGCEEDKELCSAVGKVVKDIFGSGCYDFGHSNGCDDDLDRIEMVINKDKASPTLALVAQCRPWAFIKTDKLVRTAAADLDLWYSAELVCDATVASITSNTEKNNVMVTSYPKFEPSDSISTTFVDLPLREDTIAHLTTRALIDSALDLRLYRRADLFASKFYAFGGPERFAEARFLHACDTITKVVKRKQPQIIEKQVLRIDECVARVSKDLNLSDTGVQKIGIGEVPIETMPQYIRDFALRRLRVSNMSVAALRLANLWSMNYEEDPVVLAEEEKRRQLTYVQWNDDGCPGNNAGKTQPLPDLISDEVNLVEEFKVLLQAGDTIGFDAEWGEDNGVAVLQLSTVSYSILLDIPALSSTDEGCRSLQTTVGKLFAGLTSARYVVGFGCKEDIKRLRDSPCSLSIHWFPHNNCTARDLRPLIAEASPGLGGKGGQHLGLSRSTESFLGKQLDKAEQCSDWQIRPLSIEQREYAALDAWACAAIHAKIINERYKVI